MQFCFEKSRNLTQRENAIIVFTCRVFRRNSSQNDIYWIEMRHRVGKQNKWQSTHCNEKH